MAFISQAPNVDLPATWTKIRIQQNSALTGEVNDVFFTLPAYAHLLNMIVICVGADVGATTSTLDIEGTGASGQGAAVLTGASDNGGTLGLSTTQASIAAWKTSIDAINLQTSAGVECKLNAELTYAGTATTPPIFDIYMLIAKDSR